MPPSNTTSTKSTVETDVKNELRKIKVLVVKSVATSFRRIGLAFTREATHLDASLLTSSQVNTLKSDPNLSVSEATVVVAGAAPGANAPKPTTAAEAVVTPVPAESLEETTSTTSTK